HGQSRDARRAAGHPTDLLLHRAGHLSPQVRRPQRSERVCGREDRARHGRDPEGAGRHLMRALALMLGSAIAAQAGDLVNSFREGNTVFLRLSDGAAQIEWLSESSFRYMRRWTGDFTRGPAANPKPVLVSMSDTPD